MESGHLLNSRGLVLSIFYTTVYRKEGTGAPSLNTEALAATRRKKLESGEIVCINSRGKVDLVAAHHLY